MEARGILRATIVAAALCGLGAGYRTENFVIDAPTPDLAREIGDWAEKYRSELAVEWLGKQMPRWAEPCMLTARVAPHLGAGGATSFVFDRGEVYGWRMTIQGSRERILDSVLPHEVTHTVFACHFRRALPRWADEGACTTVEHPSEKRKQQQMLISFLKTGRGISFSKMFAMKEYPQDVMPLYSQGYSLARYLIARSGKAEFITFIENGLRDENWNRAIEEHYGFESLLALQNNWLDWVREGSPNLPSTPTTLVASASQPAQNPVFRGQSPDPPPPSRSLATVPKRKSTAQQSGSGSLYPGPATIDAATSEARSTQSARPQPPEHTRQIILEYERTPRPTGAPRSPSPPRGPILDASRGSGTYRR